MSEIWKDIPGYEGKYQVSNKGCVRSLLFHNAKGVKRIGYLRQAKDGKGYLRCALSKNNVLRTFKVHRLVASAFIPNPNDYPQVNHINGIKHDNRAENLEWCDNSMNQIHAYANGLNPHHISHCSPCAVTDSRTGIVAFFDTITEAANFIGVNRNTIAEWLSGGRQRKHKEYNVSLI